MNIAENKRAAEFVQLALQPEQKREAKKEGKQLGKKPKMQKLFREGEWQGLRIIDFAAGGGHTTLLDILVTRFGIDPTLPDGDLNKSPLHHAAQFGQDSMVEALITEHSCPIEATDCCGSTPLNVAIFNGKNNTMDILLRHGASVQGRNFFGLPIHYAALRGNYYAVQRLHQVNADVVNDVAFGFCTPLTAAVCSGSLDCVRFLAEVANTSEIAILSQAVVCRSSEGQALDCVNMLLGHGINANLLNQALFEELPIIIAAKCGWRDLVHTLLNHTDQIEGVEWSIDGLIGYVTSEGFLEKDMERKQTRINNLREMIIQELRGKHYLAAYMVHLALRTDMDAETWKNFECLCAIHWSYAEASESLSCDVGQLITIGYFMVNDDQEDMAIMAARACMALDPENEDCKELMVSAIQKFGHATASTSGNH